MTEAQRQPVPREDGGELETAVAFLDFARNSVLKKVEGVSQAEVARPMVPTGTSLLRLVRHLIDSERFWFVVQLIGEGAEPDWDAAGSDDRAMAEIVAEYRAAIRASNEAVRRLGDPAALAARPLDGERMSLRWTISHMTSETARHAGHADILRELIDGVTGR